MNSQVMNDQVINNPDVRGYVNPKGSHTGGMFSVNAVGGKRRLRRIRSRRIKSNRFRRNHSKKNRRSRRHRRKQRGGTTSPTYSSYSTVGRNEYLSKNESALASPHVAEINRMYR
jgi:hypothetical protein